MRRSGIFGVVVVAVVALVHKGRVFGIFDLVITLVGDGQLVWLF